jgi:predicted Zn-dependent protease
MELSVRHFLFAAALILPATADAADSFVQSPAYKECTALAGSNPTLALQKAEAWLRIDNSTAPLHCRAMALYGLHRFPEAAAALADVRLTIPPENIILRTYVARQASRAWVNAVQPAQAIGALSIQLNDMAGMKGDNAAIAQQSADLLLDRAKLRETYGQLTEAVQDLDHAVSLSPLNEQLLLERARVFVQLNDAALAKQDLQAVLRGNPTQAEALSMMRQLRDDAAKPATAPVAP